MTTERSIPHLRDIFGLSIKNNHNAEPVYPGDLDKPSKKSKKSSSKSSGTTNGKDNGGAGELKTLERHLSMKKTIRKKIMRDLQQAFVDDPNEFKVDTNEDRMKAELNLEAMRYGESNKHRSRKSDNFLDMLRGEQGGNNYGQQQLQNSHNLHHGSPHLRESTAAVVAAAAHNQHQVPQPYRRQDHVIPTDDGGEENYPTHNHNNSSTCSNEKQSFWSRFGIRNKNKR